MNDDSGQRAHTTPLQRKRRIHDSDDDDDCPMTTLSAVEPAGTTADPVLIQDTENESDANFGVLLLPVRQQSHDQSDYSKPARESQSRRRTRSPEITEQVQPLI